MALHHSGFSFTKRNYCRKKREHIRNSWFVDLHVQQTTDMRTSGVHPPSPDAELLELRAGFSFPFCLVDLFYFCVLYVATYFCVYISICLPLFFTYTVTYTYKIYLCQISAGFWNAIILRCFNEKPRFQGKKRLRHLQRKCAHTEKHVRIFR